MAVITDPFASYAHVYMSANQVARYSVGNHIEFDLIEFKGTDVTIADISVSTGSGQANGDITVSGARRWLVTWNGDITCDEAAFHSNWTDGAGVRLDEESGQLSPPAFRRHDGSNQNDNSLNITGQMILDATLGDIIMEARFTDFQGSGFTSRCSVKFYPLGAVA